jgi:Fe-S-cluster containining protein
MLPVPWRYVESWNCINCGICCKGFDVVLDFPEWINIVKAYGMEYTQPGISRLYLRRKTDGTCIFLQNYYGSWLCSLQHMKPIACKLWPFKVSNRPQYGRPREAEYDMTNLKLYIYVDPSCIGLRWGAPNSEFSSAILPEFIDMALGQRRRQFYSTARRFIQQPRTLI